jgi:hypothetical protein
LIIIALQGLDEPLSVVFIRLLLHMAKILCLGALVTQALLMGVQDYIVGGDGEFAAWSEIDYLGYIAQLAELLALG